MWSAMPHASLLTWRKALTIESYSFRSYYEKYDLTKTPSLKHVCKKKLIQIDYYAA